MKALPFKVVKVEQESFLVQYEKQAYFYDALHTHPEIQITCIIKGNGRLIAGSYSNRFTEGECYLLGSDLPHVFKSDPDYYKNENKEAVHSISVYFRAGVLPEKLLQLPEMGSINKLLMQSDLGYKLCNTTAIKVTNLCASLSKYSGTKRISGLIDLLGFIAESDSKQQLLKSIPRKILNAAEGERLNQVYQFTLNEFSRTIKLDEVAGLIHMTPNAFCRYFKKHTQRSYLTFLNSIRIDNTCRLLQNNNYTVSQAAFESGFNNLTNFNRIFKSIKGVTPLEFRKKNEIIF